MIAPLTYLNKFWRLTPLFNKLQRNMKAMGFNITDIPFMSDRGHFLAAVKYLEQYSNMIVTVKFCLEHIIRNVIARYNLPKEEVLTLRKGLNGIQSASTYERFLRKFDILHTMDVPETKEIVL